MDRRPFNSYARPARFCSRRPVLAGCVAASLLLVGCSRQTPAAAADLDNPVLKGRVTRVADGDSFDVQLPSGPVTVRLHSIDAPERDQPYGRAAFAALSDRIAGRTVEVEVVEQDQYDRQVAVVYVDGRNLNAELVQNGQAWAYRYFLDDPEFCRWEGVARSRRAGIWAQPTKDQIAPWEWRNLARGERFVTTDYSTRSVEDCIAAAAGSGSGETAVPAASDGNCRIKGNISDSGKLYHLPGSPDYERTRIDPARGERWFCTEQQAREQGWRRAGRSPR